MYTTYWQDMPVFHFLDSALNEMGVYDMERVKKFQANGWLCYVFKCEDEGESHEWGAFIWKTTNTGKELRIYTNRAFLKSRTWCEVLVIDQWGREIGSQYFEF